jgi:hypothetical protein
MKHLLACVLCVVLPTSMSARDNGYKVVYDGGSVSDAKTGIGLRLYIDADRVRLEKNQSDFVTKPVAAVTEISYRARFLRSILQSE